MKKRIFMLVSLLMVVASIAIADEYVYTMTMSGTDAGEVDAAEQAGDEWDWRKFMAFAWCAMDSDLGTPVLMNSTWTWSYPDYELKATYRVPWTGSGSPPAFGPPIPGMDEGDL